MLKIIISLINEKNFNPHYSQIAYFIKIDERFCPNNTKWFKNMLELNHLLSYFYLKNKIMKMKKGLVFILLITLSFVYVHSQLRQFSNDNRFALVVGNSDYAIGVLANPVDDAYAMAMALENLGFDVSLRLEVRTKDEMKRAIREFGEKLKQGGIGLFYFAGHGLQVDGFNFLIPTQAQINSQEEVEYESVDVGFVLAQMEAAQNQIA